MADARPVVRRRRSAFAAAFLSLLYPGLGHAYLGRWMRALLWGIIPTLAIAAGLGIILSAEDRTDLFAPLLDPAMSTAIYGVILVDLLYRLAAVFDAYRLARDPRVGSSGSRMLSTVGLLGVILVLIASHVAVAQPVSVGYDIINQATSNSGDESEVPDEALVENIEGFEHLRETEPPGGATGTPVEEATPGPTPSVGPGWDGKERLNILLVGMDGGRQGRSNESFLTDTMIVVSVDPRTGRVAFISLPRDMVNVPLPGGGTFGGKINTLYTTARLRPSQFAGNDRDRGYRALMGALSTLYGIKIEYYASVDLNSFRDTINTLGGVVVDVQMPVYDTGYTAADGRGKLKLYVPPGMQFMNGQRALAYARSRHGSAGGDFDRAARQQRLFTSVRDQTDLSALFAPGVLDKLLKQVTKHVKTNIPARMIPRLVSLAQEVDLDRRVNLVLAEPTYGAICYPCGPSGVWAIRPHVSKIRQAVQNVFSGNARTERDRQRVEDEAAVVHVLNGAGGSNTKATNLATALASRGLNAVVPPIAGGRADADDYRDTVITVYNGAGAGLTETLKRLRQTFDGVEIVEADDPDQRADIVIIVGERTKPLKGRR